MFKISQSTSYTWPVSYDLPIDGGKFAKQTFDAEFRRMLQTDIDEAIKAISTDGNYPYTDFIRAVWIGWKGVIDEDGNEVPFSETARDQLLNLPRLAQTLTEVFFESVAGAKRKN